MQQVAVSLYRIFLALAQKMKNMEGVYKHYSTDALTFASKLKINTQLLIFDILI